MSASADLPWRKCRPKSYHWLNGETAWRGAMQPLISTAKVINAYRAASPSAEANIASLGSKIGTNMASLPLGGWLCRAFLMSAIVSNIKAWRRLIIIIINRRGTCRAVSGSMCSLYNGAIRIILYRRAWLARPSCARMSILRAFLMAACWRRGIACAHALDKNMP